MAATTTAIQSRRGRLRVRCRPWTETAPNGPDHTPSPGPALRLGETPAGVIALRVARLGVRVKEVERHTLIGHLQRAVAAGDRPERSGQPWAAGRGLSTRD